ncbi:hypothetical protein ACHAWU_001852 [Discostella pseudostelligera]|uniref:Uncharacterized protein n=1 Tax=Discostella pseudostelligera TaxID=259834 RepID=A0ABD3MA80_9STRA
MACTAASGGNDAADDELEEATNDYSSYWQSIPDPPTPNMVLSATAAVASSGPIEVIDASAMGEDAAVTAAGAESQRHHHHQLRQERKRHSYAFRDVTNHPPTVNLKHTAKHDVANASKLSTSSFSILAEDDDEHPRKNVIGSGYENNNTEKTRKTKRLRRQTIPSQGAVLPLAELHNAHTITTCQSNDRTTSNSGRISCTSSMKSMIHLVRKYYSLPNENRIHVANEIHSLSGYPMPGHATNKNYTQSKEEFVLKVQPIVQAMEDRKHLDVLEAEKYTNCHVVKDVDKRGGGFCYSDVNTGEEIEAQDYKLRYAAMLYEKRRRRKEKTVDDDDCDENECCRRGDADSDFHHSDVVEEVTTTREDGVCDSCDGGSCHEDETRRESIDDSNMDMDEGVSMDESIMSLDESVVHEDAPHSDSKDASSSTADVLDTASINAESSSNNVTSRSENKPSEGAQDESNQHELDHHHDDDIRSSPHHHTALNRMPASNNPRVLAARARLWLAIDTALAAYSREIQKIQDGGGDLSGRMN